MNEKGSVTKSYRPEGENEGSRGIFDITEFVNLDKKNKLLKEHNLKKTSMKNIEKLNSAVSV